MLIHSHEEVDVVAGQSMISCDDVSADFFDRMTNVRITVRVVDRCR
jgi:hypothetical protein